MCLGPGPIKRVGEYINISRLWIRSFAAERIVPAAGKFARPLSRPKSFTSSRAKQIKRRSNDTLDSIHAKWQSRCPSPFLIDLRFAPRLRNRFRWRTRALRARAESNGRETAAFRHATRPSERPTLPLAGSFKWNGEDELNSASRSTRGLAKNNATTTTTSQLRVYQSTGTCLCIAARGDIARRRAGEAPHFHNGRNGSICHPCAAATPMRNDAPMT